MLLIKVFGLNRQLRVLDPVNITGNSVHDEVDYVLVASNASSIDDRVVFEMLFIAITLLESQHEVSLAHIFNEFVRGLTQFQDVLGQVNLQGFLKE